MSDLWGMKLNASKTNTMIVTKSRTVHPQSPPLIIGGTVLKESDDLVIGYKLPNAQPCSKVRPFFGLSKFGNSLIFSYGQFV